MEKNLTQHEIPRLPKEFNLTDGHIHRKWSKDELKIINKSSKIFKEVKRERQEILEKEFVTSSFKLARQSFSTNNMKYVINMSASVSLEIIANYLRLNKMSITLIEPCFDNLADIFKRHKIPLKPLSDEYLDKESFKEIIKKCNTDTICIVTPNNPTGIEITKDNFIYLAKYCKNNNKLLIVDCSFRFYSNPKNLFDQYKILNDIGVNYMVVEDTGKTWPTQEIKLSILAMNNSMYKPIYDIYTDFVLNVSPFALKFLKEFIDNSIKNKLAYTHKIVKDNRKILYKSLEGTILTPVEKPEVSVAWLKIEKSNSFKIKEILDKKGIHVLPGDYFYWSDRKKGNQFIRIALTRDKEKFEKMAKLLRKTLLEIS